MLSINTNLSSLITQSSLKTSTLKLNEAIERMTTGSKINHAKDNAANYSICTNMSTKISAYQVAEDNAMKGLDLLNTATGSLDLISDKLARLRALAEQSANGTYGRESKQAINSEANALVDEIQRVYSNTEYNGINLLEGELSATEESEFIKDIKRRDTNSLKKLSSVDSSQTISGTYSISSAEELAKLAEMTNNGLVSSGTEFVLASDIDLSGYANWTPIGTKDNNFSGHFNGNGYEISNLTTTDLNADAIGLFGYIANATLENVGIKDVNIKGKSYIGALTGIIKNSDVRNCFASGEIVNTRGATGGLIGKSENLVISDSYSLVNITQTGDLSQWCIGGVVGYITNGTIKGCYYNGSIVQNATQVGDSQVGGITGKLEGNCLMENCYSSGSISAKNGGGLAGIIGPGESKVKHCYTNSNFDFRMPNWSQGGITGEIYNSKVLIEECSVLSEMDNTYGIFVGVLNTRLLVNIKNCYYKQDYRDNGYREYNAHYVAEWEYVSENNQTVDSSASPPFTIENNGVISDYNSEIILQAGINSSESSRISFNTSSWLGSLEILRQIGNGNGDYLEIVDNILSNVSGKQTELGAVQNRLESALEEISIQYENLISSRSTIQDADIAKVSSEYIRQQILQQASATLMATANQTPAIALQLL